MQPFSLKTSTLNQMGTIALSHPQRHGTATVVLSLLRIACFSFNDGSSPLVNLIQLNSEENGQNLAQPTLSVPPTTVSKHI